jgi:hypothetical protein
VSAEGSDSAASVASDLPDLQSPPPTDTFPGSSSVAKDPKAERLFEANKKGLQRILKKAIKAGTGVPHRLLTTEDEFEAGLYLADATDEVDISTPLSGIMARRGIVPGTNDLADIIELAVAVTAYLVRQIQLRAQVRRGQAQQIVDVTPGADPTG